MRSEALSIALLVCVGTFAHAQSSGCGPHKNDPHDCPASSSSDATLPQSGSAIPLPPPPGVPLHPKSAAVCAAFQSQLDRYKGQIENEHAACISKGKPDRPWADGVRECNWSACEILHNYLHNGGDDAEHQEVASCRTQASQYQASLAAEQQGIHALGDALTTLIAPTPSTAIESQNDLATYEDQQKGQAVVGNNASSPLLTDSSSANIMRSTIQNNDIGQELERQLNERNPSSESASLDQQLSLADTALSLIETSAQQIGEGISNLKNSEAATALMEFLSTKVEPTASGAVTNIGGVFISLEKGLLDPDVAKGVKAISDQQKDPYKILNVNERNLMNLCAMGFPEECPPPPAKK